MRRFTATAILILAPLTAHASDPAQRARSGKKASASTRDDKRDRSLPKRVGLVGTTGNEKTLEALLDLPEFQALERDQFTRHLWFDAYMGDDRTGDGSQGNPFRSFGKAKQVCTRSTRCTFRAGQVWSPLTLKMESEGNWRPGATVEWTGAAAGTGTVLDYDGPTLTLVVHRDRGADPVATAAIGGIAIGTITDTLRGEAANATDDAIVTNGCDDPDRICILFEGEDPTNKPKIDCNDEHPAHVGGGGMGYAECTDATCGWVGWQSLDISNCGLDAFGTSGKAGSNGKLVVVNVDVESVRNHPEIRGGTGGMSNNNCFTTHRDGSLVAINVSGASRSTSDHASGSCFAPTFRGKATIITRKKIQTTMVSGQNAAMGSSGGDVVVIGAHMTGTMGGALARQGLLMNAQDNDSRYQLARVLVDCHSSTASNCKAVYVKAAATTDVVGELYQVTLRNAVHAIQTFAPVGGTITLLGRGLLIDESDYWFYGVDAVTDSATNLDIQFSNSDDSDRTGGNAAEWRVNGANHNDLASVQSAADELGWTKFWTNGFDIAGVTQWDPETYACLPTETCHGFLGNTSYAIDLANSLWPDPREHCIPPDVLGGKICTLVLNRNGPGNAGAR